MADGKKPLLDESTVRLSGLPARPEDCQEAMRNAESTPWTAREALCWMKGRDPFWFRGDIFAHYQVEADQIRRAVKTGLLDAEGSAPPQWLEFANSGGWVMPPELTPPLPATNQPEDSAAKTRRLMDSFIFGGQVVNYEFLSRRVSYSVDQFCEAHDLSRSMFYIRLKTGKGPRIMKIGHRTLISAEAAQEWRLQMEAEQ